MERVITSYRDTEHAKKMEESLGMTRYDLDMTRYD